MKKTNNRLAFVFLTIISVMFAGCGSNSSGPAALNISTPSLPAGTVGTVYSQTLAATGGTSPYTNWVVSSGTLPAGLALAPATGVISGTPTTAATSNFTVSVTDAATATVSKALSITVNAATINGVALYNQFCAGCHGALASPTREHIGATVTQINTGIASNAGGMGVFGQAGATPLSQAQIAAISLAMQ